MKKKIFNEKVIGSSWEDFKRENLTPEEQEELQIKTDIITAVIQARREAAISQKSLEEITGIKQPVISRFEREETDPQLSTVVKLLSALGFTLKVEKKQAV